MSKKKPAEKKSVVKSNNGSTASTKDKPRGPRPESYAPKQKAVTEAPKTDPAIIWNGWNGIVEIQGMRFRSSKKKLDEGSRESLQVSVLFAPSGTELYGLAGSKIFVTVPQIHSHEFRSWNKEGTVDHKRQKRLWDFLNNLFLELGMKQPPVVRQRPNHSSTNVSTSVEDLVLGVLGRYSFEEDGQPRAFFRMKMLSYKSKETGEEKHTRIVEALTINTGHELYDYVRTQYRKPFVYHDLLSRENVPSFKGEYAGDSEKIWEFLTKLIAKHRKDVLGGEADVVNPDGNVSLGGEVIYLADRRAA